MGNTQLSAAKKAKNDEFYTRMTDIEHELVHYKDHFKGNIVLCDRDDLFESNFFRYFALNFNHLGLKRLIATCYSGSPIAGGEYQPSLFDDDVDTATGRHRRAYKAVVNVFRDTTGDGGLDMDDIRNLLDSGENELTELHGDGAYGAGDFRFRECLELLDEADVVVTNPPFSLFREYVATLVEHDKKFVIVGNQNAITYKEIFPLLRDSRLWLGYGFCGNVAFFGSPTRTPRPLSPISTGTSEYPGSCGTPTWTSTSATRTSSSAAATATTRRAIRIMTTTMPSRCRRSGTFPRTIGACRSRSLIPIIPNISEILGITESNGRGMSGGVWLGGELRPRSEGKAKYGRIFIRRHLQYGRIRVVESNKNVRAFSGFRRQSHG